MILGFFSGIFNNPATRWVAGIALAIVGLSIYSARQRQIGANEYKRKAEVKARREIDTIRRDLDERVEQAEQNAASLPEYDGPSELPDHLADILLNRGDE